MLEDTGTTRRFLADTKAPDSSVCISLACSLEESTFGPITHKLVSPGQPLNIRGCGTVGDPVELENGELLLRDLTVARGGHAQIWCHDQKVSVDLRSGRSD
jgi:hypothetical protein